MEILGLFGKFNYFIDLRKSITILFGLNGTGKTTILETIWNITRGNILSIKEINFDIMTFIFTPLMSAEDELNTEPEYKITFSKSEFCPLWIDLKLPGFDEDHYRFDEQDRDLFLNLERAHEGSIKWVLKPRTAGLAFGLFNNEEEWNKMRMEATLRDTDYSMLTTIGLKRDMLIDEEKLLFFEHLYVLLFSIPCKYISTQRLSLTTENLQHFSTLVRNKEQEISNISNMIVYNKPQEKFSDYYNLDEMRKELMKQRMIFIAKSFNELLQREKKGEDSGFSYFQVLINDYLRYKKLEMKTNKVVIETDMGDYIRLENLSSGEKNLICIFYDLLFKNVRMEIFPSTILIDEPEISLHVAWQLKFIDDLKQIVKKFGFQIILATHSPEIASDESISYNMSAEE